MIAPDGDTPWEGRKRDGLVGFTPPPVALEMIADDGAVLTAGQFRLQLTGPPLRLAIEQKCGIEWQPWIADRNTGGFATAEKGTRLRHYQRREAGDMHFALGDKTGPLDRTGRRFRLLQLDALGYDAEIGDPQYKHVPFMIVRSGADENAVAGGMFYDTLAPMTFDVGAERSNYHGIYRYVEAEERSARSVADRRAGYRGRHATLYVADGTAGAAAALELRLRLHHHAPRRRRQWAGRHHRLCRALPHGRDCRSAPSISAQDIRAAASGATCSPGTRTSFPIRKRCSQSSRRLDFATVANLKPVLIDDHPDYTAVKAAGGFVKDAAGAPVVEQFWDGMGSYLDFSNLQTIRWWKERFSAQVLDRLASPPDGTTTTNTRSAARTRPRPDLARRFRPSRLDRCTRCS